MDEKRYQREVRPVVFRLLNATAIYLQRVGISESELHRAIADWLQRNDR